MQSFLQSSLEMLSVVLPELYPSTTCDSALAEQRRLLSPRCSCSLATYPWSARLPSRSLSFLTSLWDSGCLSTLQSATSSVAAFAAGRQPWGPCTADTALAELLVL